MILQSIFTLVKKIFLMKKNIQFVSLVFNGVKHIDDKSVIFNKRS